MVFKSNEILWKYVSWVKNVPKKIWAFFIRFWLGTRNFNKNISKIENFTDENFTTKFYVTISTAYAVTYRIFFNLKRNPKNKFKCIAIFFISKKIDF
jgi:hypothetical protein